MKKIVLYFKILLLLTVVVLSSPADVLAQQYEKSRSETHVFPVTVESSVQIVNKYGNIHILPWDQDSIRFEITIKISASKQTKLERAYDNIEIEHTESAYYIIMQTVFGNQKNAFWTDVTDFANSMIKGGSNAQIDYRVYMPDYVELTIENKFGNIYMTEHDGKCMITLSNGDFRGGHFTELDLDHSFGKVIIDTIGNGGLSLSYSEMKLGYGNDLYISSRSSKPEIQDFRSMNLDSKRDTYHFQHAGLINGEMSFSYMTIEELHNDLMLNTKYGNLNINDFEKSISVVNLVAEYTDVSLISGEGFSYFLEIYYDDKTRMVYPKSPPVFMVKDPETEGGKYLLSGHYGSNAEGIRRIKINIIGGSVILNHK